MHCARSAYTGVIIAPTQTAGKAMKKLELEDYKDFQPTDFSGFENLPGWDLPAELCQGG